MFAANPLRNKNQSSGQSGTVGQPSLGFGTGITFERGDDRREVGSNDLQRHAKFYRGVRSGNRVQNRGYLAACA